MISVEAIRSALPILLAETVEPKSAAEYSIRYALDWNRRVFRGIVEWCSRNGSDLLFGVLGLAITILVCSSLYHLLRRHVIPFVAKRQPGIAAELESVSGSVVRLLTWFGFAASIKTVPFGDSVHLVLNRVFYVGFILAFLNIFQHFTQCTVTLLINRFRRRHPENYSTNKLKLDLSLSIIRLLVGLYVVVFILQEVFHLKVTHLIASAGIVGLAIAFASKDAVANIFGAFFILGGKMFKMGDWIKTGTSEGVVEQIGFRSIRIRAFDNGRLIEIPNHIIADAQVENYSRHGFWREQFCFRLVYQTTPEQMALAKKILEDIGRDLSDFMVKGKPVRFEFMLFGESALDLDGFVWFKPSDLYTRRHARGRFNEEVLKRFRAAGLEMAYPTTTVVLDGSERPET